MTTTTEAITCYRCGDTICGGVNGPCDDKWSARPESPSSAALYELTKAMYELRGRDISAELIYLAALSDLVMHQMTTRVLEARHQGVTWDAIGRQLGITRQAAQQKYKRRCYCEDCLRPSEEAKSL